MWFRSSTYIREVRVRADAGFYNDAFLSELEDRAADYAVVAKVYPPLKRLLPGIAYERVNPVWEMGECWHGARPWFEPRRHIVARRLIETSRPLPPCSPGGGTSIVAGLPIGILALPGFSISMMAELPSKSASVSCAKISH